MKDFNETNIKNLVDHEDSVLVKEVVESQTYDLDVTAHKEGIGRIIEKQGHNTAAIRAILKTTTKKTQ